LKKHVLKYKFIIIFFVAIISLFCFVFIRTHQSQSASQNVQGNVLNGDTIFAKNLNVAGGQTITGYTPKALDWTVISKNMSDNLPRLERYSKVCGANCSNALSNLNPNSKPEGQVWVNNGDLTIGGAEINGKGTIIVKGNLTINGNLFYANSNSSIGFIVTGTTGTTGTITINSGVSNLVGAYYSGQGITFN